MISEAVKLNNSILTLKDWGDSVVESVNADANETVEVK